MLFLSFLILGFLLLEIEPLKVLPSISKTIVPPTRRLQTSVINVPVVSASFLLQSSAVSWRWKSLILFNAKIENIVSNNPRDDGDDNEEESCRFCDCIRHHYQQFIDQLPLSPSLHQRLQLPLQLPVISSLIEYQQEKRKQRRAQQRLSGQRPPDEDCKVPTSSQQDTCNDHDNTQMQNSTAHDHLVIQALKWFKNTYHHLHIPIEFTIPENATDPFTGSPVHPVLAKLQLGNITERYRNNGVKGHTFKQQLIDIGLLPPTSKFEESYSAIFIESALKFYRKVYNTIDIPLSYKLDGKDYEQYSSTHSTSNMKGAPLGEILSDIKRRCLHYTHYDVKHRWKPLGITFETEMDNECSQDGLLGEALKIYKQIHGNCNIPFNYVITDKEPLYPSYLHGYRLGSLYSRMSRSPRHSM